MRLRVAAFVAIVTLTGSHAVSAQPQTVPQVTAEADPGVKLTRLIDRAEVRLSRIELQPGAVRKAHAHDDVVYHLWVPITGSLEITIGSDAPVAAASGQAFFMKRGTMHGFRNTGTTPAALFEIFIKQTATAADGDPADTVRAVLAAFAGSSVDEALAGALERRRDESPASATEAAALLR